MRVDIESMLNESHDKDRQISDADAEIAHFKDVIAMNEKLRAELETMTHKWQEADAKMWAIVAESKSDTEPHGPFSPEGPVRPEDGIIPKGEK